MKKVLILVAVVPKNPESLNWLPLRDMVRMQIGFDIKVDLTALTRLVYDLNNINSKITAVDLDNCDIASYDFVIIRNVYHTQGREMGITVAHYLKMKKVLFTDSYLASMQGTGKMACAIDRITYGLPTPRTIYAKPTLLAKYIDEQSVSYPIVLKDDYGKKGRENYLVNSKDDFRRITGHINKVMFIAQEFIPNDCDYRAIVLGDKIRLLIKRTAGEGTHLNNTSQGGKAELVDVNILDKAVQQEIIKAARVEKLEVAGVDIIFDKNTGKHYFLEVNRAPQISTGAFVEDKIRAYSEWIKEEVGENDK